MEIERLEDRTQLTPITASATGLAIQVDLQSPATDGIYSLSVPQRGVLTVSLANADGSRFVGDVAILSPSFRVLRESHFAGESGTEPASLSDYVDQGVYLLRVQPADSTNAVPPQIHAEFIPITPPLHSISVGDYPRSVQVIDVNRDGFLDLVTVNQGIYDNNLQTYVGGNDVSVVLGRGDGTFADEQRVAVGAGPNSVQVIDLNEDGLLDLVTSNYGTYDAILQTYVGGNDVSVLLGREDGTFADQQRFAVGDGPFPVQVVDVDGDGRLDLLTKNERSNDVSLLLGQRGGTFADQQRFPVGDGPTDLLAVDINEDGLLDLVTSNYGTYDAILQTFVGRSDVSVLLGRGHGTFADQQRFAVGVGPTDLQAVDINFQCSIASSNSEPVAPTTAPSWEHSTASTKSPACDRFGRGLARRSTAA